MFLNFLHTKGDEAIKKEAILTATEDITRKYPGLSSIENFTVFKLLKSSTKLVKQNLFDKIEIDV